MVSDIKRKGEIMTSNHANETKGTTLIVGASRGLGHAMAAEFLGRGWNVIGTVRGSDRSQLHDLADAHPGRVEIEQLDVTEPEQIASLRTGLGGPDAPFGMDETVPQIVTTLIAQQGKPGLRYLDREGREVPW